MTRAALFVVLALSACASPEIMVPQIQLERLAPPADLLTCADEPPVPSGALSLGGLALYLVDVAEAGEDCRRRLLAVLAWRDRQQ